MATWKKVHVEDANTTHGTITATLGAGTDITSAAPSANIVVSATDGTTEGALTVAEVTFGAAAFLSAAQVITNGSGLTSSDFQKDLVGGTGISGSADNVLFGSDSDVTLALDIDGLTAANGNITVANGDLVPLYDADGNATYKATVSELVSAVSSGVTGVTFQGDDDNSGSLSGAVQLTLSGGDAITTTQTTAGNISGITIDLNIGALNGNIQPAGTGDEFVFENNDGSYQKVSMQTLALQVLDGGELTATTLTSGTIDGSDTFLVADGGRGGTANDITLTQLTAYFNDTSVLTNLVDTNTDVDVNTSNLITRLGQISENVTIGDAADVTVTIPGNLTVNGTTTTIDTTNLVVKDQFILLNDADAATDADAGIVVAGSTKSVAFGYDQNLDRWGYDKTGATSGMTTITCDAFFTHVHSAANAPGAGADSEFEQVGNMYVNTATQDIYIYS